MMTLIVRQSFSNNLFGFGAAASTLLMLAMLVWVADLVPGVQARPGGRHDRTRRSPRAPRKRSSTAALDVAHLARAARDARADPLAADRLGCRPTASLATGAYDLLHPTFDGVQPRCGQTSTSSATSSTR